MGIIWGKVFQAEGTAVKREPAWRLPGAARGQFGGRECARARSAGPQGEGAITTVALGSRGSVSTQREP